MNVCSFLQFDVSLHSLFVVGFSLALMTLTIRYQVSVFALALYKRVDLHLTAVPDDIPADTRWVYLYNNEISRIRINVFSHLTNCTKLWMSSNSISVIEPDAFNGLQSLQVLDLRYNSISEINARDFSELQSLQVLDLSNNAIEYIHVEAFQKLQSMKTLWLKANSLAVIHQEVFKELYSLNRLHLEQNELSILYSVAFSDLPRPLTLVLSNSEVPLYSDNPLQCNPGFCWLKREEEAGAIRWWRGNKPRCADGTVWESWTCDTSCEDQKILLCYRST